MHSPAFKLFYTPDILHKRQKRKISVWLNQCIYFFGFFFAFRLKKKGHEKHFFHFFRQKSVVRKTLFFETPFKGALWKKGSFLTFWVTRFAVGQNGQWGPKAMKNLGSISGVPFSFFLSISNSRFFHFGCKKTAKNAFFSIFEFWGTPEPGFRDSFGCMSSVQHSICLY